MTYFIKLENGQPASNAIAEENFRQLFPNTSFPVYFTADSVEPLGYGIYDFSNQPGRGRYQKVVETSPVRNEFGIWRQAWQVVEMTEVEKAAEDADQAKAVRADRDRRLKDTDWVVIKHLERNENIPGAWEVYRQALRDVPSQAGFPWTVNWPEQPA